MIDAEVLFILWLPHQQTLGIGKEGAVNEAQANMIGVDADLADASADRSAALFEIIGESPAVLRLGGGGGNAGNKTAELEDDIPELRRDILEVFFNRMFG